MEQLPTSYPAHRRGPKCPLGNCKLKTPGSVSEDCSIFDARGLYLEVSETGRTAKRRLQEFMDRVRLANARKIYAYKIDRVVLFGSML